MSKYNRNRKETKENSPIMAKNDADNPKTRPCHYHQLAKLLLFSQLVLLNLSNPSAALALSS
jgi:hypothetical protein